FIFSSFFLHSYGVLRYLHSFPTRRSSDLVIGQGVADADPTAPTVPADFGASTLYVCVARNVLQALPVGDQGALIKAYRTVNGRRDRKSTRLNSSHVEISYAVFCLKKKKKK